MTATTVKSSKVSNDFDVSPRTIEQAGKNGGLLKISTDTIEAATTSTDEAGDIILMLPLDSNTRLHSLVLFNDDLDTGGTSGAVNIGLYNGPDKFVTSAGTAYAAYGVIDEDCFATAITTLTAANTAGVEVRHEAGGGVNGDIADIGKRLWEVVGLPEDPVRKFVVSIKVTTQMTTPAAGTISLRAQHSD